ncbi:MAG TPA: low temperature requirement protein A [Solirubrobacteraceae bacterium]|nr:low temperature requirement protein A [Solirubrobacteraceae bacterium]
MSEHGKRVTFVELYLDLVFVLAVGQLAHLVVDDPRMHSVWTALGLFFVLWWTWVGFAVLYSRHGDDEPRQRLLILAGSVPAGVAAVAIGPASTGHGTVFALSLAATRLVLASAHAAGGGREDLLRKRITRACLISALLFVVSIWVPEPFRYALWAIAIAVESRELLAEDREANRRLRREHDLAALAPTDPAEALDAHHFSERFGLFVIILLGEVVVQAGQASVDGHVATTGGWAALVAAMLLAAGLWWLYFDSAARINLKVLDLSGGSPTMAKAIFAVGHMLPAFALLLTAAGVGLLLGHDPPRLAYVLACVGIGIYLGGTRVFMAAKGRAAHVVRLVVLVATFQLGRLRPDLSPHEYLWLLAAWVAMCAALTTRGTDAAADDEALARYTRGR